MVIDAGRALVIAYNKWDLVDEDRRHFLDREIDRQLHTARWAPRVNISAATGWHVDRLVPALELALDSWETRVPTGRLQRLAHRACRGDPAAVPRRQAAQGPVRDPGRDPAAAFRAVHHRLPAGRLPPVHRAAAARGVRLRGQPGAPVDAAAGRSARAGAAVRPAAASSAEPVRGPAGPPAGGGPRRLALRVGRRGPRVTARTTRWSRTRRGHSPTGRPAVCTGTGRARRTRSRAPLTSGVLRSEPWSATSIRTRRLSRQR